MPDPVDGGNAVPGNPKRSAEPVSIAQNIRVDLIRSIGNRFENTQNNINQPKGAGRSFVAVRTVIVPQLSPAYRFQFVNKKGKGNKKNFTPHDAYRFSVLTTLYIILYRVQRQRSVQWSHTASAQLTELSRLRHINSATKSPTDYPHTHTHIYIYMYV